MSEIHWVKQLEKDANNNLGQNFLIDSNISRKITKLVQGQLGDPILEIGPGTGSLTVSYTHLTLPTPPYV